MVFCNKVALFFKDVCPKGHNPYFSRWFSAISKTTQRNQKTTKVTILILVDGFLQYKMTKIYKKVLNVTILILVDGFLQYRRLLKRTSNNRSQSLF